MTTNPLVNLGSYQWTVRSGLNGPCTYNVNGVSQLVQKRIRLTLVKNNGLWESAGVIGPVLGYGTHQVEITGRLDGMDPRSVFAFWFHNEDTRDEVDIVESSRWGDLNQPNLFTTTYWQKQEIYARKVWPARCYNRYRFTGVLDAKVTSLKGEGQLPDGTWKEIFSDQQESKVFGFRPKLAVWVPNDGKLSFGTAASYGPLSVTIDKFSYVPSLVP